MQIIFNVNDTVEVELTEEGAKKYNSEMLERINLLAISDDEKKQYIEEYMSSSFKVAGSKLVMPFWHLTQIFSNIKNKQYFKDDKIILKQ